MGAGRLSAGLSPAAVVVRISVHVRIRISRRRTGTDSRRHTDKAHSPEAAARKLLPVLRNRRAAADSDGLAGADTRLDAGSLLVRDRLHRCRSGQMEGQQRIQEEPCCADPGSPPTRPVLHPYRRPRRWQRLGHPRRWRQWPHPMRRRRQYCRQCNRPCPGCWCQILGRQRIRIAAKTKGGQLKRDTCSALQFTRLLDVDYPARDLGPTRNRQHIADIDALGQGSLEEVSGLHFLGIQRLAGANRQQHAGGQSDRAGRWRGGALGLLALIAIGLVLAGLVGRARRLTVAYAGPFAGGIRPLIRILARTLIRVLLPRILARSLVRRLVLILRRSIRRGNLSILGIGRRPRRTPITLLAWRRRLLPRSCCAHGNQGRSQTPSLRPTLRKASIANDFC